MTRSVLGCSLAAALTVGCSSDELPKHCSGFKDADRSSGQQVSVKLTNGRGEAIEIITSPYDGQPAFSLANVDANLTWDPDSNCNVYRCSQVMAGQCDLACPGCSVTEAIRLSSGESTSFIWPGLIFMDETLPSDCSGNGPYCDEWPAAHDGQCVQGIAAPPGTYTVSSEAQLPCLGGGGEDCGGGETGGETDCGPGGPRVTATATFEHPSTRMVEVVFE